MNLSSKKIFPEFSMFQNNQKKRCTRKTLVVGAKNLLDADHTCFFRPAIFLVKKTLVFSALQMLDEKNV
jgi:hypothetical protein